MVPTWRVHGVSLHAHPLRRRRNRLHGPGSPFPLPQPCVTPAQPPAPSRSCPPRAGQPLTWATNSPPRPYSWPSSHPLPQTSASSCSPQTLLERGLHSWGGPATSTHPAPPQDLPFPSWPQRGPGQTCLGAVHQRGARGDTVIWNSSSVYVRAFFSFSSSLHLHWVKGSGSRTSLMWRNGACSIVMFCGLTSVHMKERNEGAKTVEATVWGTTAAAASCGLLELKEKYLLNNGIN